MANDKEQEATYKEIGRRRIFLRQQKRKSNWSEKARKYGRGSSICSMCGGHQSWCSCCEMWSSNCCCDYGTCQCS